MVKTKELVSIMSVTILGLLIGVIGSSIIGFSMGGFDTAEILDQFQQYTPLLIAGAIIHLLAVLIELLINKGDKKYGDYLFFNSQGEGPSFDFFGNYSGVQLFILSFLFFGLLGFIVPLVTSQTTFTGVGTLSQQFTETGAILYSAFLIPITENLGVGAVAVAFIVFLRFLARKQDWTPDTFNASAVVSTILIWGIIGVANHLLRYGASEVAVLTVAGFWAISGMLCVITGSWIPAWVLHINNNLFYAMKDIFASDVAIVWLGGLFVLLGISYIYIYREDGAWYKGVNKVKRGNK
ncbi:MAG: hypothetical protein ACOCV1_04420 [Bacillota bacterium]